MSKLTKKIVVPISLTLTGCLVVAAFVLNDSLTKVDANVAFNGISDIVSSHGKDKPQCSGAFVEKSFLLVC